MIYCLCMFVGIVLSVEGRYQDWDKFYSNCSLFDNSTLYSGPVCGSDFITYSNLVHMSCLNHWRSQEKKVHMVSTGSCNITKDSKDCEKSPIYAPVCGTDNVTYANLEALKCHAVRNKSSVALKRKGHCNETDPCAPKRWVSPVCASNGKTYYNPNVIRCLRKYHSGLRIIHDQGCTAEEVDALYNHDRAKICKIAQTHYEWNPKCGSDNQVCTNPFTFLCTKPHLDVAFEGECDNELRQHCEAAEKLDKEEPCKKKESKKEVCGSDGQTYPSLHHLKCATARNKHLKLLHSGVCTGKDHPCLAEALEGPGYPVCGSDGITYTSPDALMCIATTKDPGLTLHYDGECIPHHYSPENN